MFDTAASIPMGSLFRIPIRLSVLFFVILVPQVAFAGIQSGWWALYWFILLGPILLLTVLVHELGHCLATRQVGGEAHSILLWPLGGLAYVGHTSGAKADMWVAFAGPLTHVPMLLFWILLLLPAYHAVTGSYKIQLLLFDPPSPPYLWVDICVGSVVLNLSLFIFNLFVPAYPLDGGRIFADALLTCGVSEVSAAKATVGVSAIMGVAVVVWGIMQFQIVTLMVGFFILLSTYTLLRCVLDGQVKSHPLFAHVEPSITTDRNGPYQPYADQASRV